MKHSELRHQPRHVNPRIQDLYYTMHLFAKQIFVLYFIEIVGTPNSSLK